MNRKPINWIILIVLALIWGSSFILMKRGLEVYSSDEVAALRILIAFLFLSPLIIKHVKRPLLKYWKGFFRNGNAWQFYPGIFIYQSRKQASAAH